MGEYLFRSNTVAKHMHNQMTGKLLFSCTEDSGGDTSLFIMRPEFTTHFTIYNYILVNCRSSKYVLGQLIL